MINSFVKLMLLLWLLVGSQSALTAYSCKDYNKELVLPALIMTIKEYMHNPYSFEYVSFKEYRLRDIDTEYPDHTAFILRYRGHNILGVPVLSIAGTIIDNKTCKPTKMMDGWKDIPVVLADKIKGL